jgi:hypothetical protein
MPLPLPVRQQAALSVPVIYQTIARSGDLCSTG